MKTKLGFIGMLIGTAGMLALPALAQERGNYRNNANTGNYAPQQYTQPYSNNQQVYGQPQSNEVRPYGNSYSGNSYRGDSYGSNSYYSAPQSYERSEWSRHEAREWAWRHRRYERRFWNDRWGWR